MKKEDCFELGIVARTYSFKGELILHFDADQPEEYYELDHVFLEINKQLVPFFIEESRMSKHNQIRVKFENVESEAEAERLLKKKIFLPLTMLPELDDQDFYLHEIEGYKIIDLESEHVGVLKEVIDNPGNRLISVDYDGIEALIPFNDDTIKEVNKSKKEFSISVPPGLLDMYLD